ncbi:MAG TPA: hypothetical protein VGT40_05895 [Methylomirabilota bacterium]|jgi:hypothetical protein|nr:hypothetical protein [Methylomirabilota bacterium]
MAQLIVGFVLIALIALVTFRHRSLGLALLATAALVLVYVDFLHVRDQRQREARIAVSEIELADVRLAEQEGFYRLFGRVRNGSHRYVLESLRLHVTVADCLGSACRIAAERDESLVLPVLPGQDHGFELSLGRLGMPGGHYLARCTVLRAESG